MRKTRLFVKVKTLNIGSQVSIDGGDFEYLSKVLRKKIGDQITIFNGFDGDFIAKITQINKRQLILEISNKLTNQQPQGFITLAFAPVKNVRIDFVAAKATEMGVTKFLPILTQHTIVDKINVERFTANIKEAVEQCERNDIPEILPLEKLDKFLKQAQISDKLLILCDESGQGKKASELLPLLAKTRITTQEVVLLIGPEGGFSQEEFAQMRQIKNIHAISLGPRILRSDTAIIAALALIQEFF